MEELIFTPDQGLYTAQFVSGTANVVQLKTPVAPTQLSIYCRISDEFDWKMISNTPNPPKDSIFELNIPASIDVKIVTDVQPEFAAVRLD